VTMNIETFPMRKLILLILGLLLLLLAWRSHAAPAARTRKPADPVHFLHSFRFYGNVANALSPVTCSQAQRPAVRVCPLAAV
jgi:hypothetical protein